jgi:hypothetical protein
MKSEQQVQQMIEEQEVIRVEAISEMESTQAALIAANTLNDFEIAVRSRVAHDEATGNLVWCNAVIATLKGVLQNDEA